MPLPKKWHKKSHKTKEPPEGFAQVLEPTLEALEHELRDQIKSCSDKKRKTESMWPVHQINWQKSRYVYDMYYTYGKISKEVYQYCCDQKYIDTALIAKWKKPGYERLCSTYVINPNNYKFGNVSICRVPWKDRSPEQKGAQDPTTGCLGCASGKDQPRNIFGNKYGQSLAAVQIAREERLLKQQQQQAAAALEKPQQRVQGDGDEETDDEEDDDDDDDDDDGPSPAVAGIWAGSQKLEPTGATTAGFPPPDHDDNAGEEETDDDDDDDSEDDDEGPALPPPTKKARGEETTTTTTTTSH